MSKKLEISELGLREELEKFLGRSDNLSGLEPYAIADLLDQIKKISERHTSVSILLMNHLRSLGNKSQLKEHEESVHNVLEHRTAEAVRYLSGVLGAPCNPLDDTPERSGVDYADPRAPGDVNPNDGLRSRYVKGLQYPRAGDSFGDVSDDGQDLIVTDSKEADTDVTTALPSSMLSNPNQSAPPPRDVLVDRPERNCDADKVEYAPASSNKTKSRYEDAHISIPKPASRRYAPSLTTLISERDSASMELRSFIRRPLPLADDAEHLRRRIDTLKELSSSLQNKCGSLVKWFVSHGATQESEEASDSCQSQMNEVRQMMSEIQREVDARAWSAAAASVVALSLNAAHDSRTHRASPEHHPIHRTQTFAASSVSSLSYRGTSSPEPELPLEKRSGITEQGLAPVFLEPIKRVNFASSQVETAETSSAVTAPRAYGDYSLSVEQQGLPSHLIDIDGGAELMGYGRNSLESYQASRSHALDWLNKTPPTTTGLQTMSIPREYHPMRSVVDPGRFLLASQGARASRPETLFRTPGEDPGRRTRPCAGTDEFSGRIHSVQPQDQRAESFPGQPEPSRQQSYHRGLGRPKTLNPQASATRFDEFADNNSNRNRFRPCEPEPWYDMSGREERFRQATRLEYQYGKPSFYSSDAQSRTQRDTRFMHEPSDMFNWGKRSSEDFRSHREAPPYRGHYSGTLSSGQRWHHELPGTYPGVRTGDNVFCRNRDGLSAYHGTYSSKNDCDTHANNSHFGHPNIFPTESYRPIASELYPGTRDLYNGFPRPERESDRVQSEFFRDQLRRELLRGFGTPFDGTPEKYHAWRAQLTLQLEKAHCSSQEILYVLLSNTTGKPKALVEDLLTNCVDPEYTLQLAWHDLEKRFGSSLRVSRRLLEKLALFPKIRDITQIEQMESLLSICRSIMCSMASCRELGVFNYRSGLQKVWEKMPDSFVARWRRDAVRLERRSGLEPTLDFLYDHISDYVDEVSDITYVSYSDSVNTAKPQKTLSTKTLPMKTDETTASSGGSSRVDHCIWHECNGHSLSDCRKFNSLPYTEKIAFLRQRKRCFKCTGEHFVTSCREALKCQICDNDHVTILCKNAPAEIAASSAGASANHDPVNTRTHCTQVCGSSASPERCCSKTLSVEVRVKGTSRAIPCLAIVDEQSTASFCDPELPDILGVSTTSSSYSLTTLSHSQMPVSGYVVPGLEVRGVNETAWTDLPPVLTHPCLPDTSDEVATRAVVSAHEHLRHLAHHFPSQKPIHPVRLLIGANCGTAMQTFSHGHTYPFVHRSFLGWSLVGPVCVRSNGPRDATRCLRIDAHAKCEHFEARRCFETRNNHSYIPDAPDVFKETADDELIGVSGEDRKFLEIVSAGITTNSKGNLEIPLPFRPGIQLPDNKFAIYHRTRNTLKKLLDNPDKVQACTDTMQKYIDADHVEELPSDAASPTGKTNYLAVFPVVHQKKGKIRLVFDSSSKFRGISLNDALLRGPDVANKLIGVLLRFRRHKVAFVADVECMFHAFYVPPADRDALRFFWWRNNDPSSEIVAHRAKVHIFGNRSSPAIATHGLRYAASVCDFSTSDEAKSFIHTNFYVDDGLGSAPDAGSAVRTLREAREILSRKNIRLHKIVSTSDEVLKAFPATELAENLSSVELSASPLQSTLGLSWDVVSDSFHLKYQEPRRDFTRRGILSINGSLYDILGIAAPVSLDGKLLQRKFISSKENGKFGWDDPLPLQFLPEWEIWTSQLVQIPKLVLPRCLSRPYIRDSDALEMHVFTDASDQAIAHVIYLRTRGSSGQISVSFLYGNSKVAPRAATTIPRLELCAAVDAARSARHIASELNLTLSSTAFYSDSRVVLGYINNDTRAFTRYVTARRDSILRMSDRSQWHYVRSDENPADIATRPKTVAAVLDSEWLTGPSFLRGDYDGKMDVIWEVELPECTEVKTVLRSNCSNNQVLAWMVTRYSSWKKVLNIMRYIIKFTKLCRREITSGEDLTESASDFLVRECQKECFPEYPLLARGRLLPRDSRLLCLAPFMDDRGVLRVGGRLSRGSFTFSEKHPQLLPQKHPITVMIGAHFHEKTSHQGRVITGAMIRQEGFHILNQAKFLSTVINSCVLCKRLRMLPTPQLMADLPPDRLEKTAPFLFSGVDVFGPYLIHDGRSTRRSSCTRKLWVLLFTCLYSRAVHIETLSSLDVTSLKLALRRFAAIRGKCAIFRSDCGTNFVGAKNLTESEAEMGALLGDCETEVVDWRFNPPRASHFAGVWERKVGSIKRILNNSIYLNKHVQLSREEFSTLLSEAVSVVNCTPLGAPSADPNDPFPVCPANLLTLREDPHPSSSCGPPSERDLLSYGKRRYRRVEYLAEEFWKGWKRDYLQHLQKRNKWKVPGRNIETGDVVLVREESARNDWPMGVVLHTKVSTDGRVRSVSIKLKPSSTGADRIIKRAVHDVLVLLPKAE